MPPERDSMFSEGVGCVRIYTVAFLFIRHCSRADCKFVFTAFILDQLSEYEFSHRWSANVSVAHKYDFCPFLFHIPIFTCLCRLNVFMFNDFQILVPSFPRGNLPLSWRPFQDCWSTALNLLESEMFLLRAKIQILLQSLKLHTRQCNYMQPQCKD